MIIEAKKILRLNMELSYEKVAERKKRYRNLREGIQQESEELLLIITKEKEVQSRSDEKQDNVIERLQKNSKSLTDGLKDIIQDKIAHA